MKTVGIICEYNPLHLGHQKQIHRIREEFGPDCSIVCVMSGNFVQRGAPAIIDKSLRAKAAVLCGADLVLELPITSALSSAEGFAAGGVRILSRLCDTLCFGTENGNASSLMQTARTLLSPEFSDALRIELDKGMGMPAILESLAHVEFTADEPFERVLHLEMRRMRRVGCTIVIAAQLSSRMVDAMASMRRMGPYVRLYLVTFTPEDPPLLPMLSRLQNAGVEVCYVTPVAM